MAQSTPNLYHTEDFVKTGVVGTVTLIAEQNITYFFKSTYPIHIKGEASIH